MGQVLYNYINASPRNWGVTGDRGFDLAIQSGGYAEFLGPHQDYVTEAAGRNCTLGLSLFCPWGRGPTYHQLPNGTYTAITLDQKLQCSIEGYTTITQSLIDNTEPSKTNLYLGSVPVSTLEEAELLTHLEAGYLMSFDALTTFDADSTMFQEIRAQHDLGRRVWAEANKEYKGLKLAAFAGLWENPNRVSTQDAPDGSIWWWRNPTQDGTWSHEIAETKLSHGLDLWVRLDQLSEGAREALFDLAAAYEAVRYPNNAISVVPPRKGIFRHPKGYWSKSGN